MAKRVRDSVQIVWTYSNIDLDELKNRVEEIKRDNPSGDSFRIELETYWDYDVEAAGLFVIFERDETEEEKEKRLKWEEGRSKMEKRQYEELKKKFESS